MCSGGSNSKQEQQAADQTRQQELNLMQQQLQRQMDQVSQVNSVLDPIISNGGTTPSEESATRSQLMDSLPAQFRSAKGQINQDLVARGIVGGTNAGSGDIARNFGQLDAMEAGLQQRGMTDILLQKANLLRQALAAKMGVANLFGNNTSMFNTGGINALNSGVTAAKNADASAFNPWGAILGAGLSLGGKALGNELPGVFG